MEEYRFGQEEGRVRQQTPERAKEKIDRETAASVQETAMRGDQAISDRLSELNNEWSIERVLELNAALIGLGGTILGSFFSRRWLWVPAVVTTFLAQHAIQGWCPPLPLFRWMGYRTRREIDREKFALKSMRGDFGVSAASSDEALREVDQE